MYFVLPSACMSVRTSACLYSTRASVSAQKCVKEGGRQTISVTGV